MDSKMKKAKRLIGMMMTLLTMACVGAATALQASAAQLKQSIMIKAASPTETLLVVVIVILVIALVAGGVILFLVLSKKKDSSSGQPAAPVSNYPPRPQQMQQNPPYAAPQSYNRPPQAPAMNNQQAPAAPQAQNNNFNNAAPAAGAPAYNAMPSDGAGDTTVLGAGAAGFILLRKNGGDKIRINKAEFIIGKEKAKVDYCISNNNSISRKHAKIKVRAGKCYISDLGSTNCTYINGTKLNPNQEVALIPGDKIKFSNEEFEFIG